MGGRELAREFVTWGRPCSQQAREISTGLSCNLHEGKLPEKPRPRSHSHGGPLRASPGPELEFYPIMLVHPLLPSIYGGHPGRLAIASHHWSPCLPVIFVPWSSFHLPEAMKLPLRPPAHSPLVFPLPSKTQRLSGSPTGISPWARPALPCPALLGLASLPGPSGLVHYDRPSQKAWGGQ